MPKAHGAQTSLDSEAALLEWRQFGGQLNSRVQPSDSPAFRWKSWIPKSWAPTGGFDLRNTVGSYGPRSQRDPPVVDLATSSGLAVLKELGDDDFGEGALRRHRRAALRPSSTIHQCWEPRGVCQTPFDQLVRPFQTEDERWTVDARAPLHGRVSMAASGSRSERQCRRKWSDDIKRSDTIPALIALSTFVTHWIQIASRNIRFWRRVLR